MDPAVRFGQATSDDGWDDDEQGAACHEEASEASDDEEEEGDNDEDEEEESEEEDVHGFVSPVCLMRNASCFAAALGRFGKITGTGNKTHGPP